MVNILHKHSFCFTIEFGVTETRFKVGTVSNVTGVSVYNSTVSNITGVSFTIAQSLMLWESLFTMSGLIFKNKYSR